MQSKKQEIFDHFLLFRLHTLICSFISSGVSFILYGVLHIVVVRIVQQPILLINHLSLTPVLLLYLIHISKLLFAIHYPGSLTASDLTLGGSFTRSSTLCIWMTTVAAMRRDQLLLGMIVIYNVSCFFSIFQFFSFKSYFSKYTDYFIRDNFYDSRF